MAEDIYSLQKRDSFIKRCQKFESVKPKDNKFKLPKFKLVSPKSSSSSEELFYNTERSEKVIDSSKA